MISKFIQVNIKEGDKLKVDKAFGNPIGGKIGMVISWRWSCHCESGIMVRLDIYDGELDSNWLEQLNPRLQTGGQAYG